MFHLWLTIEYFSFFVSKYKSALPSSPDNISNSINLIVEFSRNHNFSGKKVHLTLRKRKTSRISFCDIKNLDNFHLLRAKVLVGTISVINNVLLEENLSSLFHSSCVFADLVIILLVVEGHHRSLGVCDPGDGGHVVRNILHHPVTILINLGKKIEAGAVPTEHPSQGQQRGSS